MRNSLAAAAVVVAGMIFHAAPASAVLSSQDGNVLPEVAALEVAPLQARLYHVPGSRVLGQVSVRQGVTLWEITAGMWNGESLQGLTLVLVDKSSESNPSCAVTRCYVSHGATSAQRDALLDAYLTSQALPSDGIADWRVEPAVIRVERAGSVVIVHLGLVA